MTPKTNSMMKILLLTFTALIVPSTPATIKIAFFCTKEPWYPPQFSAGKTVGALVYALQQIQADPALLPGHDFEVIYRDSGCISKSGLAELMDIFAAGLQPDLILGPLCTRAMLPVAKQAASVNLPAVAWVASDPPLADKTVHATLVRVLMSINAYSKGLVELLKEFNWKQAVLLSYDGSDYNIVGNSIRDYILEEQGMSITQWIRDIPESADQAAIQAHLRDIKEESRIIIIVTPTSAIRSWALAAFDEGLSGGEYVLIYMNQQLLDEAMMAEVTSRAFWEGDDGRNDDVRDMMRSLLMLWTKMTDFAENKRYLEAFHTAALRSSLPGQLGLTPVMGDIYSLFMYDAMLAYAKLATQAGTYSDGGKIMMEAQNSIITGGATGDITFDANADRTADFWLFNFLDNDTFSIVSETVTTKDGSQLKWTWYYFEEPRWGNGLRGKENAPLDEPACGFDGRKCPNLGLYIGLPVAAFVVIVAVIAGVFIGRKVKYESDLKSMAWKMEASELVLYTGAHGGGPGSMMNMRSSANLRSSSKGSVAGDSMAGRQLFITAATYHGTTVAVKPVRKMRLKFERELLQEMRNMVEMKHANINPFVGAVTEASPGMSVSWEYATKGSLQDVIWADNISLDEMFKFSICIDIIKGLTYIHDNQHFKYHGRLKSSNVVIDGRWVCKLTDFGLQTFCEGEDEDDEMSHHAKYSALFWTAPELLREHHSDLDNVKVRLRYGSPAGDIYSFAIILKETFCRNGPFTEHEDLDPKEILKRILNEQNCTSNNANENLPFRPSLEEMADDVSDVDVLEALRSLIQQCWSEDPRERPTVRETAKKLAKINPFKKTNVMDNMMAMMEKYSAQLEEIVAERTEQLAEERNKTEELLLKMLPKSVAEDLKVGKTVDPESFDCVTMYFSDIPGFSEFAATSTPHQVVDLLNAIYSLMDEHIGHHDVYKVETVGDVYVLVSGLPQRNGDRHIVEIVNCALDLLSAMMSFVTPHKPQHKCKLRMGINTGPIVTGVVGLAMPRYCLFGDTINTTSRMESTGKPMRIHMSPSAKTALSKFAGYKIAERGLIPVKGKGDMCTYWVLGREGFDKQLPNWNEVFKDDSPKPQFLPVTTGKTIEPRHGRPSVESGFAEAIEAPPALFIPNQDENKEKVQQPIIEKQLSNEPMENNSGEVPSTDSNENNESHLSEDVDLNQNKSDSDNLAAADKEDKVFKSMKRRKTLVMETVDQNMMEDLDEADFDVDQDSNVKTPREDQVLSSTIDMEASDKNGLTPIDGIDR